MYVSHVVKVKYSVGLAKCLACPLLTRKVIGSHPDRVIPKTMMK